MSELGEIRDRLTSIEVQMTERKESGNDKLDDIDGKIDCLFEKFDAAIVAVDKKDEKVKNYCRTLVGWVIGVPATITGILGAIWLIIKIVDG